MIPPHTPCSLSPLFISSSIPVTTVLFAHRHTPISLTSRPSRPRPRKSARPRPLSDSARAGRPAKPARAPASTPARRAPSRARPVILGEVLAAQRLRKQGDWRAAQAQLDAVRPRAERDTNFLNELLHVRAVELRTRPTRLSAAALYADLAAVLEAAPARHNCTTYNAVLAGVREAGGEGTLDVADAVFDRMVHTAVFPDHFTMSILFHMCAAARSARHARRFETKAKEAFGFEANVISGSALLAAYAKCGELDCAEAVMEDLLSRGVVLNERTYASMISAYHRSGRHAKVLDCLDVALGSKSVQPNLFLFSGAFASCCKASDAANARRLYHEMVRSKVAPTEEIFATLFETALRGRDIVFGLQVLLDFAPQYGLLRPDASHFDRLISACKLANYSSTKTAELVGMVLRRMKEETALVPDVSTLNALISAFIDKGLYSAAYGVVVRDFETCGLAPDVATYNTLIHSLGRANRPELATKAFTIMQKKGVEPNQATYNALLELLLKSGDDDVTSAIADMVSKGLVTETDPLVTSFRLKMYRSAKDPQSALQTFQRARKTGVTLDSKTHGLLLKTLLENHLESIAISVLGYLMWKGMGSTGILNVMVDYVGRVRKDSMQSMALFESMKRKGIAPDAVTYATLIRTCSRHGLMDRAFRLLSEMQDVGLGMADTFSWTALIDGCGRMGQWQRAEELLRLMCDPESRLKQIPAPTTSCYNAALYAVGMKGGGWKRTCKVYSLLKDDENQEPNLVTYSSMGSAILRNRAEITEWDLVREVCAELQRLYYSGVGQAHEVHQHGSEPVSDARSDLGTLPRRLRSKVRRLQWLLQQVDSGTLPRRSDEG